jgi:hypothetical protein
LELVRWSCNYASFQMRVLASFSLNVASKCLLLHHIPSHSSHPNPQPRTSTNSRDRLRLIVRCRLWLPLSKMYRNIFSAPPAHSLFHPSPLNIRACLWTFPMFCALLSLSHRIANPGSALRISQIELPPCRLLTPHRNFCPQITA